MKRKMLIVAITALFFSCTDDGKLNEKKIDEAGEKLQKTVEKGADTIGSKLKKLKNKIDEKTDSL